MSAIVGKNVIRKDAWAKVTGTAKYTDDYYVPGMLHAKIKRSEITAGRIVDVDCSAAKALPGVKAVFTYEDIPKIKFPTAGHPFAIEPGARDVADRMLLTDKVRFFGDEIAVVVATSEEIAEDAVSLINVEYETYDPITDGRDAIVSDAREIHEGTHNVIKDTVQQRGSVEKGFAQAELIFESEYDTQIVQHCAMENHTAYAYVEEDRRITVVSSTQIPHICRRIISHALDIPAGEIRVIKPVIGGGFGSKQDVVLEPLVAFLTLKMNGKPVRVRYSREETFLATRTRNPISYKLKVGLKKDGTMTAWTCEAVCSGGGYASHGHAIIGRGCNKIYCMYPVKNYYYHAVSTYTNTPVAGAMRAYGTPQVMFMFESAVNDMARLIGMDPVEFRRKNMIGPDFIEPTTEKPIQSYALEDVIAAAEKASDYAAKKEENRLFNESMEQVGKPLRRGIGMATISYNPFPWPGILDTAEAMLTINQDGSFILQSGATEIGQGSDCVLSQIAAEAIGVSFEKIHILSNQNTDVTPFDTGAYSSRQTFDAGNAVRMAGLEMHRKITEYAAELLGCAAEELDVKDNNVVDSRGDIRMTLAELAIQSYYNKENGRVLYAKATNNNHSNALIYGACFANVEVDLSTCKVKVLAMHEVMDVGRLINPELARGQVLGCMSMGHGYALSEKLIIDPKSGKVLNSNLLDYKLNTTMDTPDFETIFLEHPDPAGPYGAKGLGEPPTVPVAPAIRNAVLAATGVSFNSLPLSPQTLFEGFKKNGLIQ